MWDTLASSIWPLRYGTVRVTSAITRVHGSVTGQTGENCHTKFDSGIRVTGCRACRRSRRRPAELEISL